MAARQGRIDIIETHKLGSEAQTGAALELMDSDPARAKELWDQWYLRSSAKEWDAQRFYVDVRMAEARDDPAKLNEFLVCFDGGDSPRNHDMCANMVALPTALYRLREDDKLGKEQTKTMVEQVYPVLANWKCRREKADCDCYDRRDRALSFLLTVMAQQDRERAKQMIVCLPPQFAKVMALKSFLLHAEPDEDTIEQTIQAIQMVFDKPFELANSYYDLAVVLPSDKLEWINRIIQMAEPLMGGQTWPTPPARLRINRAKAFIKLVASPEQLRDVRKVIDDVPGFLWNKLDVLNVLSEQALAWSSDDRLDLLWQAWELTTTKGEVDVAASIVFGVPILESLLDVGKQEILWRLYDEIEWAYQELPRFVAE